MQKRRWARLVELQAAGFNQDDHHGNKYTGTNPGGLLRYLSHTRSRNALGPRLGNSAGGWRARREFLFSVPGEVAGLPDMDGRQERRLRGDTRLSL